MIRPASLREVAERQVEAPRTPLSKPLGEFLDGFYEPDADRPAMLAEEPAVANLPVETAAYLAATAEHLSLIYRLAPPAWVAKPAYFLDQAFWPDPPGRAAEAMWLAESPIAFRRRFIFTEAQPLRRKQGPRFAA